MKTEKELQAEREAAEAKAEVKVDAKTKAATDKAEADKAALSKLTDEQAKLAKEQADLGVKFAAEKEKQRLNVKVEDLPELLPTSPENEWRDREKLLKELEKK